LAAWVTKETTQAGGLGPDPFTLSRQVGLSAGIRTGVATLELASSGGSNPR